MSSDPSATTPSDSTSPSDSTHPAPLTIPEATLATSHVDQLAPSPPHPDAALASLSPEVSSAEEEEGEGGPNFSSLADREQNGVEKLELPPPQSGVVKEEQASIPPPPPAAVPSTFATTSSHTKPHPADLVSLSNPDPHESDVGTPMSEPETSPLDMSRAASTVGRAVSNGASPNPSASGSVVVNGAGAEVPRAVNGAPELGANGAKRERDVSGASGSERGAGDKERDREKEKERERRKEREREKEKSGGSSSGRKEKEKESSTRSRRVLGEWTMSKTLGAGSMGKVKLGISGISGEKVAIKIIPRFTSTASAHRSPPNPDPKDPNPKPLDKLEPTASFLAKAAAKDASKEIRTMREGSLCLLLYHPYICGMRSMVLYPNHYYMVFEYVNGGQMLDYIISHGRLRERSARKFARQIGSALEYSHANSIVHRDLKIENILISKTGNIKIIDFGLSNLYAPTNHLSTFCGSLYFAAPELLNAKPYTGPEVDVWSFGIVLYVLVCGKVPFDDQSMPALHAKIKRGQVEYPTWLSAECKHLLSRMLVTTPSQRASLSEVLSHPWMIKGFSGPPSNHLPARVPLRAEEIDKDVIKGMVGFEFGTDWEIEAKLLDVLESDLYKAAVRNWESKRLSGDGDSDVEKLQSERPAMRTDGKDMKGGIGRSPTSKRFSGLGFYGKKLAGGINAAFASGGKDDHDSAHSTNTSASTLAGVRAEMLDPTRGFHPLISIYYLVREKIEREKIYGPGVFASSTLSLTGPPPPPAPTQAYQAGAGPTPKEPENVKPSTLAAAAAAAEAARALEKDLGPPPPSATPRSPAPAPLTPQPRSRATADDFPGTPPRTAPSARASFAANRASYYEGAPIPRSAGPPAARPVSAYEPASPSPIARHAETDTEEALSPTSQGGFARRFGSLLGRSSPASEGGFQKGHRQRASIAGTTHRGNTRAPVGALPQVSEGLRQTTGSDVPLPSPPEGKSVVRSSTVGELSPTRHQRGVSMGAAVGTGSPASLGRASGLATAERRRQVSLGSKPPGGRPRTEDATGMLDERGEEEELAEPEEALDDRAGAQESIGRPSSSLSGPTSAGATGSEQAKPVWLKGLFSVATTSTKPVSVLKGDLVTVFGRLGVQYREVKTGFECAHVPSIDFSTVGAAPKAATNGKEKGTLRRKASGLLLAPKKETATQADDSQLSLGGGHGNRHASSTSFTDIPPVSPDPDQIQGGRFSSSTRDGAAQSDLVVRFDVTIVKMPLLPGIVGIKFHRTSGQAWQYAQLAKKVLQELSRLDGKR